MYLVEQRCPSPIYLFQPCHLHSNEFSPALLFQSNVLKPALHLGQLKCIIKTKIINNESIRIKVPENFFFYSLFKFHSAILFRLFKSHIYFRPDSHLNPAPAKDEFPIVLFVWTAKYIDIQLWIVMLTGLYYKDKCGQSGGPYVCIVAEIGVIFGNYYYRG